MEINTCGIQDDGSFIVNKGTPNQFCIPDDMGNRHRVMIQEWMDAGNVPEPYVGPTDLENWVEEMARSDKTLLPRYMEDLITDNPSLTIHEKIKIRYDEKVALRATKP